MKPDYFSETGRTGIEEKVKEIVFDIMEGEDGEVIKPESRFEEDLCLDSLDAVEMILKVEDKFCILISDEESEHIKTVGELCDTVENKLKEKNK